MQKNFEQQHLRKGFTEKITVLRILDSRRENFKLSKAYAEKIEVINIITAPEIEMLVIHSEGKYVEFKKSGEKPSEFCISDLHFNDVKSREFIVNYFSDERKLIDAIKKYKSKANIRNGEYSLADLLKQRV